MLQLKKIFVLLIVEIANPHGICGFLSPIPTPASPIPTVVWITLGVRLGFWVREVLHANQRDGDDALIWTSAAAIG
jgi:hypothetical protein